MIEELGVSPRTIHQGDFGRLSVEFFGIHIGVLPLVTLALAIVLFVVLQLVLRRTEIGRTVRATADNSEVVRLMGVRPASIYNIVMGVSFALAGVAGLMLALRTTFTPFSGVERLLISFEVVVMGGLGSFWGAMLGGIALGVAQLVGLRLNPNSGFLYANLVFLAFVMLRPNGLFGART
jgi:branched-chain amino acid transport system permease protein